ncbi:393_t:CDS:2 [Paraglomus occultum]|uniref:393_t:CDS:1 n=1 Tax=Paraglomus occultum TaxID=144539 RepID=A0A9N9BFM2_9GLOM|nr:393_t:CDS:2 [Paraglomus occultum]
MTSAAKELYRPIPKVIKHYFPKKKVIFAGTDPGIVTTTTTIPKTLEEICADIDRFQALLLSGTDGFDKQFSVKQLPRCSKITSGLINSVTFLRRHQKKDERRRTNGMDELIRQKKLSKGHREREIRIQRAYGKIIGQERRQIRAYAQPSVGKQVPAIIHCCGHWKSTGSTIKGQSRRGTKKIIEQYRNHGHVEFTNERNTSKICPYCFSEIDLHKTRRIVNGTEKIVRCS